MGAISKEGEPQVITRPVTELKLFPNRVGYWTQIETFETMLKGVMGKRESVIYAERKAQNKFELGDRRINTRAEEAREDDASIQSSIIVGKAYLHIHDELIAKGVAITDVNTFFLTCLEIEARASEESKKISHDNSIRRIIQDKGSFDRKVDKNSRMFLSSKVPMPSWFYGRPMEWETFVFDHSSFGYMLYPQDFKVVLDPKAGWDSIIPLPHSRLKPTQRSSFPDWVERLKDEVVDLKSVRDELAEDEATHEQLGIKFENMDEQFERLERVFYEGDLRSRRYIANLQIETLNKITSFPELVLYLSATQDFYSCPKVLEEYEMSNPGDRKKFAELYYFTPEETRENIIEDFLKKKLYSTELLALWFERKIKESKAGIVMGDSITPEFKDVLLCGDSLQGEKLQELKIKNKKLHDVLKFELFPFFNTLSAEEKEYLRNFSEEHGEITYGEFIMEASEVLSLKESRGELLDKTPELGKKEGELKKASKNIISKNFMWFADELKNARKNKNVIEEKPPRLKEVEEEQPQETFYEPNEHEVENEEDGLKGWKLFYARKKKVDPDHLDMLGGESLAERVEGLKGYMSREGFSFPVKLSSVINALEELALLDNENIRKKTRMIIGDEVFVRIERGKRGRIFAQVDKEMKQINFFLVGKTDFHYTFIHEYL